MYGGNYLGKKINSMNKNFYFSLGMMNPNPVPRMPNYINPQMPYGPINGNGNNQPQINIPQNNLVKNIKSPSSEIKPPFNEIIDQNIPFPPEPEPEDIKIEKENN